jgi:transposase
MQVITIGIDLAKNVFQVHGVDANDKVVFNKPLRRSQALPFFAKLAPSLIGMEACASAHYWGTRTQEARPRCPTDAGQRRQGVRQAQQE